MVQVCHYSNAASFVSDLNLDWNRRRFIFTRKRLLSYTGTAQCLSSCRIRGNWSIILFKEDAYTVKICY